MSSDSRLKFVSRPGPERGHFDKTWLQTYHTFSFEKFQDNRHSDWGPLRVLNEDFIQKGKGFGEHAHEEFEIWTYMIKGEITHRDSLGHTEVLQAGDVQCEHYHIFVQ
jgi:quercetin 2,3-dioxygenase